MNEQEKRNAVNEALGFKNAQDLEQDITQWLDQQAEGGQSMVLVLLDVDEFLRVNETWGRDAGDKALIDTGRYLADSLPQQAALYRVAGDEFGVMFTDMEKEEVFLLMEQLRRGYPVKLPDGEALTVSVGIASAPDDAARCMDLMRKAESAMYRAKYGGRDRVCLAREEKMVPKTSHYTADQLKRLTKLSKREGVGEAILLREALDMLLKKYRD